MPRLSFATVALALSVFLPLVPAHAIEESTKQTGPLVKPASDEGENAIKGFTLPKGFKCELFAAEPLFANPVSFSIDEQGRFYVAETFRFDRGVPDIRGRMSWLDDELASKSVEDRLTYTKRIEKDNLSWYTSGDDRISLIWDSTGSGKADKSVVFAEGFNHAMEGVGAGVLARRGSVYYTDIPNLWLLQDKNGDGKADVRKSLSYGYGVRFGFLGHDLHGLRIGPDGRLYFSIGDRGGHIVQKNGKVVENTEAGAVYRCDLDGSNLEIFHIGLRNPQELVFDDFGNLWTSDNNSDAGDPARITYVTQDGDSGWRVGWQFIERPFARSSWLTERLCYEYFLDRAAYTVPPVSSKVGNGPSGITYDPGVGLPPEWRGRFFLCNFSGNPRSGIFSFAVQPNGAGFDLKDNKKFWWDFLPTDVDFGYDGCLYASDWINGWSGLGKGRIYRLFEPAAREQALATGVKQLFAEGFTQRSVKELTSLLGHPDHRVRQEAQFALVEKKAKTELYATALSSTNLYARLHGIWGLGQLTRQGKSVDLRPLLADREDEVRAQTAKIIIDKPDAKYQVLLTGLLSDPAPRVRYFAAMALGKIGKSESVPALLDLVRHNNDQDPWIRHAAIMGLLGCSNEKYFASLANDPAASVRLAAVVALRRLGSPSLSLYLNDSEPRVVAEAARAINDLPVVASLPDLAALAAKADQLAALPAGDATHPGPRDAILRRVLNANFRVGAPANSTAVAAWAGNDKLPEPVRIEALSFLGSWAKPDGKDEITGLWRPLPERAAPDAHGLEPLALSLISGNAPIGAKVALFGMAEHLGWKSLGEPALKVVKDTHVDRKARVAALNYLGTTQPPQLAEAVAFAKNDKVEDLRTAATKYLALVAGSGGATASLELTLKTGGMREKQAALTALGDVKEPAADTLLAGWLDNLIAGKVEGELQLELLDAAAKHPAAVVKDKLAKYNASRPDKDGLGPYLECLKGGRAEEGKRIFFEKPEASCIRCHKVGNDGGEAGPNLTEVGKRADRNYILESILYPNKKIAVGFETLIITMKDGTSFAGIKKGETEDTIQLLSPEEGGFVTNTLKKADIKKRGIGLSGMPDTMKDLLSKREIRDLVEYLSNRK